MNPNQSHIAGLDLALQQWNNGGPSAHFAAQLRDLIDQAKQADHSAHHLNMVGGDHVPGATKMVTAYISGHLDEIDAPAWQFINAEALKVGPAKGHIDNYRYELANGGVVALWDGYHLHALAVTIRDTMNRTRCVRMLAASPSPVADLLALLERCQERLDPHRDAVLWGDVCAAFTSQKVKP